MNTHDHADEAIRALQESGIRSVFAFGFPNTSLQEWWFGPDYAGSVRTIDGDDARRLRKQYFSSDDQLITMALATRGTNFCREEVVRYEWELAKELDLNITVHVAMYRFGYTKMQLRQLQQMDLLYPNTTYIHSSHLLDDEWAMVRDSGSNVSYAPQIELQMGHGWAQAVTALDYGVPIGLSSDVATTAPSDQFTQMRAIFGVGTSPTLRSGLGPEPRVERARKQAHHVAPGPGDGDPRRCEGRRHRRSRGIDHARQEGRHRDHRRLGRECRAGHRPRRGRRLRRRHLERPDGPDRRQDREGRLPPHGRSRRPAQADQGIRRLPRRRRRPATRLVAAAGHRVAVPRRRRLATARSRARLPDRAPTRRGDAAVKGIRILGTNRSTIRPADDVAVWARASTAVTEI